MRLNIGTLLVGVFAILFGLIGAYALRAALTTPPQAAAAGPRTVTVPQASNDLPVGRKLVLSDMVMVPMTAEQVKEKGYPLDQLMISTDQIIGRVLCGPLHRGDAFLTSNLFLEGSAPSVEEKLAPGFRAFTIPMDDLNAVGGVAAAGQNVDVVFRMAAQPGDPFRRVPPMAETTVTLIENIEILAINREVLAAPVGQGLDVRTNVNRKPTPIIGPIRSVTVAVTPDQANILKAATGRGEMALRLRNINDSISKQTLGPITIEKLIGFKPSEERNKIPNRVEIYRAGGLQVMPYDDDNYFPGTGGPNGGYGASTTGYGWGGGWGGAGGWGGGNYGGNMAFGGGGLGWGSQAFGGGLRYYGNGFGGAHGNYNYGNNYGGGYGWGGMGATPTNTILPYPGLPPRAANPDSMYQPQMPGGVMPNNAGQTAPGMQNANAAAVMPVAVDWTMPYGSSYAYVSPFYSYPFAPPYIPAVNGQ